MQAMGRGPNRAAHIHFKVKAAGYEQVITHVFPPDCLYPETDAVFGVKETLIGDFRQLADGSWALDWDFTLARAG
jgi:hydroxyquinol 1,2-dioxygenase